MSGRPDRSSLSWPLTGTDGGRNTVLDTALVHESYLKFLGAGQLRAEDRRAFFAYASRVMHSDSGKA